MSSESAPSSSAVALAADIEQERRTQAMLLGEEEERKVGARRLSSSVKAAFQNIAGGEENQKGFETSSGWENPENHTGEEKDDAVDRRNSAEYLRVRKNRLSSRTMSRIRGERKDSVGGDTWRKRDKHIFVLSNAGKPVYSRYGDESHLSSLFGMLQAILSRTEEKLKNVRAGEHEIVFLVRNPLFLVAVARTGEPTAYLERQLSYIHSYILFHMTAKSLNDIFRRNASYDLRGLLGGTSGFESLLHMAHATCSLSLEAPPSLRIPVDVRSAATDVLMSVKQTNLIYAVLLADSCLVTLISPKRHPMTNSDLLLLINFVNSTQQLRSQETWTPLCLPGFNDQGFLNAYAAFLSENVCLFLISAENTLEQFHYSSECKTKISNRLRKTGTLASIEAVLKQSVYGPSEFVPARSPSTSFQAHYARSLTSPLPSGFVICSIVYSRKYRQYIETTTAEHFPLYRNKAARQHLYRRFAHMRNSMHQRLGGRLDGTVASGGGHVGGGVGATLSASDGGPVISEMWDESADAPILGVRTSLFELYTAFAPFTTPERSAPCSQALLKWAFRERAHLFLKRHPYW